MMAISTIPVSPGIPSQRLRVTLDRREFVLDLRWSMREARWYLDVRDSGGVLLVGGVKVVTSWPLLARFRTVVGVPAGDLMIDDGRANPADPTLEDLGASAQLQYLDAAEIAAWQTATAVSVGGGLPVIIGEVPL
jgi:hypothetical protein